MIKPVIITLLLLIAAYCSYQMSSIVGWQRLLRAKQTTFGVKHDEQGSSITWIKQLRMVSMTCAAMVLIVPSSSFPFQRQTMTNQEQKLRHEAKEDSSNLLPESFTKMTQDKLITTNDNASISSFQSPATTSMPTAGEITHPETHVTTTNASLSQDGPQIDVLSDWTRLQTDSVLIEEIQVESIETAGELVTREWVTTLLKKQPVAVNVSFEAADYEVNVRLADGIWFHFFLVVENEACYLLDVRLKRVYLLS